jgi:basic membrane protein A and related proteins
VLAFHTGSNAVMVAAQERGKMAVAYHSDMSKVAPDAQIVAVTHRWGDYYTQRAQAVLDGSWKSGAVWGGIQQGMVRVEGFGPKVSVAVRNEVLARQREIAAGLVSAFEAKRQAVLDNEGNAVIPPNTTLSDKEILNMNYLVAGVLGKIAK